MVEYKQFILYNTYGGIFMTRKILAFVLMLALLVPFVAACNGGGGESGTKGGEEQNLLGTWKGLDFKGSTLTVSISTNQNTETTFPAANIYTRGPEGASNDKVQKMAADRNANVEQTLGLNVEYQETDLKYDEVLDDVKQRVQVNDGAPDIYNNDIYGLLRGMLADLFRNVMTCNSDETNHLDFPETVEGDQASPWYWEYMLGTTFTEDKIYLLVGDYFIDVIRYAWVIYVNVEKFNETWEADQGGIEYLYQDVLDGKFDYDLLMMYMEHSWADDGNGEPGPEDDLISFLGASVMPRVFVWTNGISIATEDKTAIRENVADLYDCTKKYKELFNTDGVYEFVTHSASTNGVLDATTLFLNKNVLFTMSVLGEMESEQVRNTEGLTKGVLPYPKYDQTQQPNYHTLVHNQAEIAAILNTTKKFTEATAWLQLINEMSTPVLSEYYEKSLKLKYNDDPLNKQMIDLVHDTIDSPFESLIISLVTEDSTIKTNIFEYFQNDATKMSDSFNSSYAGAYPSYKSYYEQVRNTYMGLAD